MPISREDRLFISGPFILKKNHPALSLAGMDFVDDGDRYQ